jgi:ASC-1-like (ASCH) protein
MTQWQSGRESSLLDDIVAGRKRIEGRLNKGKFAEYKVGDTVSLRRDIRSSDGILRDGEPNAVTVEVVAIRNYPDFLTMVTTEGFQNVIPSAKTAKEAAGMYNKFYTAEDQAAFGVLAIQVTLITTPKNREVPLKS